MAPIEKELIDINLLNNNYQIDLVNNHNFVSVKWNNFTKLISYHDLVNNYNEVNLENFKKKYTY